MRLPPIARAFIPFRVLDDALDPSRTVYERVANWVFFTGFFSALFSGLTSRDYNVALSNFFYALIVVALLGGLLIEALPVVFPALRDEEHRVGVWGMIRGALAILGKTILYVFVPAATITALLVLWALHAGYSLR